MATTILQATEADYELIADIGRIAVKEAHKDSCSAEDMKAFLDDNYSHGAIKAELSDTRNVYHIVYSNGLPAGFSKIILSVAHPNLPDANTTKLDRIYLLKEYHGIGIGNELLQFNIRYSKQHDQSGMWLFTWIGNLRAVTFYTRAGFAIIGSHEFKVSETHYNPNYHMLLTY